MKKLALLIWIISFTVAAEAQVNWQDRRSIGQVILSSSSAVSRTNPRGWFNNPDLDVITPEGIAQFQEWLLIGAQQIAARAKAMNSQGVIVWDIEGQQYGPYLGDPRVLSPEIRHAVDEFFWIFREAGLRVGVLIRPQRWTGSTEVDTDNPARILQQKIDFAKRRWGATLFYVDSNTTIACCNFAPAAAGFRKLAAAYPDSLFIPEWESPEFYAFSAPYNELRMGIAETSLNLRPGFSVINTADGDFKTYHDQLLDGVRHGDVLLYRAWWDAEENPKVQAIYAEAAQ